MKFLSVKDSLEGVQINYEKFKNLLQHLGFIDLKKASPLDMALVSDLWQ